MKKLGACITQSYPFNRASLLLVNMLLMKKKLSLCSNKTLKFHSGRVRSLNSSIKRIKERVNLTLEMACLRLETVLCHSLRTLHKFLNLAVMILAASVMWLGAVHPCWTIDVKSWCSIQKNFKMKSTAFWDRGGDGYNTWDMIRSLHYQWVNKGGRISQSPISRSKKPVQTFQKREDYLLVQVSLLPFRGNCTKPKALIASLKRYISEWSPPGLFLSTGLL